MSEHKYPPDEPYCMLCGVFRPAEDDDPCLLYEDGVKMMKALHSRDQQRIDLMLKDINIEKALDVLEKRGLVKQGPSYIKNYAFMTSIILTDLGMSWKPPHV